MASPQLDEEMAALKEKPIVVSTKKTTTFRSGSLLVMCLVVAALVFAHLAINGTPTSSNVALTSDFWIRSLPNVTDEREGYRRHPNYYVDTYQSRARQPTNPTGSFSWTLSRPTQTPDDFYTRFPNRDVESFPDDAWQSNATYVQDFVTNGIQLVDEALESILEEYGHGLIHEPNRSFAERSKLFSFDFIDENAPRKYTNGGWLTHAAYEGLVRRFLHAVVTEDSFVVVLGGHSAAAGKGNHFQQSYLLQLQRVLEPLFERLGVYFECRNMAMGGMGTLHSAMGSGDIYGRDIDLLLWDSGMTERDEAHVDLFARQALLAGDKVPVILGRTGIWATTETGSIATERSDWEATEGIIKTASHEQAQQIPWAMRYLACTKPFRGECRYNYYTGTCWLNRTDTPSPLALKEALQRWQASEDLILPNDAWHTGPLYRTIQDGVRSATSSPCLDRGTVISPFCRYPMRAATEYTPRHDPFRTSFRELVRNDVGGPRRNLYDPPDVYNPHLYPEDGVMDIVGILEQGIPFEPTIGRRRRALQTAPSEGISLSTSPSYITPGRGWSLDVWTGYGDGTYDSFGGTDGECPLSGHNDYRGALVGDCLSGWLVWTVPDVKEGHVVIKVEDEYWNGKTTGWECENNECGETVTNTTNPSADHERRLKKQPPPDWCDDFQVDIAINGEVSTWNKATWDQRKVSLQRVVDVVTLVHAPSVQGDVEVGLRLRGCGRQRALKVTHVYWA